MPSQDLNRAIQLARAGDKKSARQILLHLVEEDPANEMAWIWLADTMPDDARRIATLKQCLKMIPESQLARKALQVLLEQGKMPPAAEGKTTPPPPAAAQVPESPASPPLFSAQDDLLSLREEVILPAEEQPDIGPFLTEEAEEAAPLVPDEKSPPLQWPAAGQKPVEPYVDNEAIEQLRRQAGKAGSSPAVKMAEATQVVGKKVNPVRWGAIFLVVVLAVVVGVVVFTLWFSPNSPYRLSFMQPLPTQLSGYQPPQETPVIETPIEVTPLITEEVETTEEVEETVESTPPPPGIYLSGSQVNSFDWSPDDTFVAVSAGGGLSVYEPQNFGTLRYIDLTGSYAVCRISPIVDRLVCAGSMLWAWTLPDWNLEISTPPPGGLPGSRIGLFQFVTSDLLALVYESDLQSVEIWSLGLQQRDGDLLRASSPIQRLVTSPENGLIAAGLFDGQVIIWGLENRQVVFQQPLEDQPIMWLGLSADGRRLMTATSLPLVHVWDISSAELIAEIEPPETFTALTFSADGRFILWADKNGLITVQEVEDGSLIQQIESGVPVQEIHLSPDQRRVAVLTMLGDIYFYELMP